MLRREMSSSPMKTLFYRTYFLRQEFQWRQTTIASRLHLASEKNDPSVIFVDFLIGCWYRSPKAAQGGKP
jgi:hypothetical protein